MLRAFGKYIIARVIDENTEDFAEDSVFKTAEIVDFDRDVYLGKFAVGDTFLIPAEAAQRKVEDNLILILDNHLLCRA